MSKFLTTLSALLLTKWLLVTAVEAAARGPVIQLPITDRDDIRFTHVSAEQGLSQSRIGQITQDDQGFLWFGTQDGLKRYDGYRFREYRHDSNNPESLSGGSIRALYKDQSGKLWVASDLYLDRYEPEREAFVHQRFEPGQLEGPVTNIVQDRDGILWLTTNHGLTRLNLATRQTVHYEHKPGDPDSLSSNLVRSTFEARDGTFWVATTEALEVLDRRTGRVGRRFPIRPFVRSAPARILFSEDQRGVLWVAASTARGLLAVDRGANRITEYPIAGPEPGRLRMAGVLAMHEDMDGVLWLATDGYGLLKLDRDRKAFSRYRRIAEDADGINSDVISAFFEDLQGNNWVGTVGAGVGRFPRQPLPFRRYRYGSSNQAASVYEDSHGAVWVGSPKGISHVDRSTMRLSYYESSSWPAELKAAYVISIIEDHFGRFWYGTRGKGLFCVDGRTGRVEAYRNQVSDPNSLSDNIVNTLFVGRDGTLWAGTEHGLSAFDSQQKHFRVYRAGDGELSRYHSIAEDNQGNMWVSTWHAGIQRLDPATGKFAIIRRDQSIPGSLSSDLVNSIALDQTGTLWVGTPSGLDRFDASHGTFRTYSDRDGLPNNNVIAILEGAPSELWIGTSYGLSRFDTATQSFRNYYDTDGILGNEFDGFNVGWKSRSGELFFCSYGGITAFFPDQIVEKTHDARIVITDFQLFGKPVTIGGASPLHSSMPFIHSLTLAHEQNIFSLEFSALDYSDPERDRYRYRLDPLERGWNEIDARRRSVIYTTLPAGNYTFRVQARSNRGHWDETGANVRIRILAPWWATWQFRGCVVAGVLLLAIAGYRWRLYQMAREFNANLEGRVDERLRVARDLHDTLLQSFHGLLMRFQAAHNLLPGRAADARRVLETALDDAAKAITQARDAVQDLRSSTVITSDLAKALEAVGDELSGQQSAGTAYGPSFSVKLEGAAQDLHPILRDEIYGIAREALRNAFHHARARRIEVEIRYEARQLRVQVRDDGTGIDPSVMRQAGRPGHWGMSGMRERAQGVGGQLEVWSEHGAGTEIELTVPASAAYLAHGGRRLHSFKKKLEADS
jgi:ligand-binding sensor domain-containing protein/signal transduction histidine kinase